MTCRRKCSKRHLRSRRMSPCCSNHSATEGVQNASTTPSQPIEEPEPTYIQEPLPDDPERLQDLFQKECLRSHPSHPISPFFPRHFLPALSSSEEQLPVPSRSDASSVHAAPTHRRRSGRAARRQPMGTSLHERRHRRRLPASPPPALRPPKRLALPRTRNQRHRGFVVDSSRNSRQHWRKLSSL